MDRADNELISSIASDVMACLVRAGYFQKLDDVLSPEDSSSTPRTCDQTYKLSESILLASGFEREELDDIYAVLQSKGGYCDCEVLYNVSETNRLKATYWRARGAGRTAHTRHDPSD
jgi:Protein of unknown function (DUF2695)